VATRLSAGGTGFAVVREALQRAQARHQQPEPSEETPQT